MHDVHITYAQRFCNPEPSPTRAEQLHARHAEEISAAKEAMTALLRQSPDLLKPDAYNDLIVAYRNGSPVRIRDIGQAIEAPENGMLAMTPLKEVRCPAEGLSREELTSRIGRCSETSPS